VLIVVVGAMVVLIGGDAWAKKKKARAKPSFFKTVEVRSSNLKPFKKWRSALGRYYRETKKNKQKKLTCSSKRLNICNYGDWAKFIKSLQGKGRFAQLKSVNARMNKAKYTSDKTNWGRKDYWATPGEFMSRFGDCEDYAIVKYLSLRMLGFKEHQLRVVAVKDLNLKVGHAILMVTLRDKKKRKRYFVLDNQIKQVVESYKIKHYQPVFSINKQHWWRHLPKTAAG
jgi:predicted transglutaminase-like cysteine proteinase